MRPTTRAARGQALPLALACLFIFISLFAFALRSSRRLIQREQSRARADVTALSSMVAYARGLNVLAATQKGVALGWVALVFDAGRTKDAIQRVQAQLLRFGPWINEAAALNVGAENGLLVLPVWNQSVLFEDLSPEDLLPSYNVMPFSISDAIAKVLATAADKVDPAALRSAQDKAEAALDDALQRNPGIPRPDGLLKTDHYEYKRKDGTVVVLGKDEAGPVNESNGRGGRVTRHKAGAAHKYRYVKAVKKVDTKYQLSLREGKPHMVTLLAWRPGIALNIVQAQAAGGSQSMVDPDGSSYGATLVPVQLFPDSVIAPEGGTPTPLASLTLARNALNALPVDAATLAPADQALALAQSLFEIRH